MLWLLWSSAGPGAKHTDFSAETLCLEVCLVSNPQKDFQSLGLLCVEPLPIINYCAQLNL